MQIDLKTWNALIATFPDPHILQTWLWGQVKMHNGWHPIRLCWNDGEEGYQEDGGIQYRELDSESTDAAALVLERVIKVPGIGAGLRVMYVPKGPLLRDWRNDDLRMRVFDGLEDIAKRRGAIFIKIDPDVRHGKGIPGLTDSCEEPVGEQVEADLLARGWCFSNEQIQFRNTVLVDLTSSEEDLLASMKQKTRYNVRLATRKGVKIRAGTDEDFGLLYRMYTETADRDGFVIRDESYYRIAWGTFYEQGMADPLIAEVDGEPIAGLVNLRFGKKAWYMYGMSREAHREKMPNYLLQWEAIRRAKAAGCTVYDLWGAPDKFEKSDPMWGVYRFKEGLGGKVVRHIGAWDLPIRPLLYQLYIKLLPRVLELMRERGMARVHNSTTA